MIVTSPEPPEHFLHLDELIALSISDLRYCDGFFLTRLWVAWSISDMRHCVCFLHALIGSWLAFPLRFTLAPVVELIPRLIIGL